VVIVRGPRRTALLVEALWERGRDIINDSDWRGGQHFTHVLASQLIVRAVKLMRGLRVGDKTLEPEVVKGSGYFSIVLGARLVGAGGEAEDVAVKVFVGRGAEDACKAELTTLQALTAKISPAALVVRLVGVVETSEGVALPWPALVMTPLCVESLEQRIDRFAREPYTLDEALAWAVQVALSLHRLHRESRLRHGDVTLRNVLLGRDGRANLVDMGVAEHNHPYGRQPQQERQGKDYSSSVAPEMVEGDEGALSSSSDARADVWSWGVLLHALLTRSTETAKEGSISAYLTMMETKQWWEDARELWAPDLVTKGVIEAVKHSLCKREERVGLLTEAMLLGQQGLVQETVRGMSVPEEVKEAELSIVTAEGLMAFVSIGAMSYPEGATEMMTLAALAHCYTTVGDEAQALACRQRASRLLTSQAQDVITDQTQDDERIGVLHGFATALQRRGDYEKAVDLYRQILAAQRRSVPGDHPDTAGTLNNLAMCLDSQGKDGEASVLHKEALAMRRRLSSDNHLDTAFALDGTAQCHVREGEYDEAVLLQEEALDAAAIATGGPPGHREVSDQSSQHSCEPVQARRCHIVV
jgi:hypothetical protein